MRLVSLHLQNYRKFRNAMIEFPDGVTGLLGNNGAGKSTIIEAMGWAIYGNKAARTKKEEIKRRGAPSNEACRVFLQFELAGDKYEVMREMLGKNMTSNAIVKVNGMLAASSAIEATNFLEKRIGMDHDSFFTSLIARQKELNALSDKTPGERKKTMMRLLHIDAVDEAMAMVREDKKTKKMKMEAIQAYLKDVEEIKKSLSEAREMKEKMEERSRELKEEIFEMEKKSVELKKIREEEKKKLEEYNRLDRKYGLIEERLKTKRAMMEEKEIELEKLLKDKKELDRLIPKEIEYMECSEKKEKMENVKEKYINKKRLEEGIGLIEKEIEEINLERNKAMKELDELKGIGEKLDAVLNEKESLNNKKEKFDKEIQRMKIDISHIKRELEKNEKDREKIAALGPKGNCPTCKRPLEDRYPKLLKDYEEKMVNGKKKIFVLNQEIEEGISEKRKLEEKLEKLSKKKKDFLEKTREKEMIKRDMEHYDKNRKGKEGKMGEKKSKIMEIGEVSFDEKIYREISEKVGKLRKEKERAIVLRNEVKRIEGMKEDIHLIKGDVDSLNEQKNELSNEIEKLGFDKKRYDSIQKSYDDLREKISIKRERRVEMDTNLQRKEEEIYRIKGEIEEQEKYRKKIKDINKEIGYLEQLVGYRDTGLLNDFKRYLISRIRPSLSHYGSELLANFTNGKYTDMELDGDYNIYIYDDGEKRPFEYFSGGEGDLANLCLRLAISQIITQRSGMDFQFIALDEIFGSQDRERKKNVLKALSELSRNFRQILLITHVEEVKDFMENVINVVEQDDGTSRIEMV